MSKSSVKRPQKQIRVKVKGFHDCIKEEGNLRGTQEASQEGRIIRCFF
jgi:hypothetical protein